MKLHDVKVYPSKVDLPREDQLAWKIAGVAADKVAVPKDTTEMIINRIIDNASVAIAAVNRRPVVSARDMARGHAKKGAATVFGMPAGKTVTVYLGAQGVRFCQAGVDGVRRFLPGTYKVRFGVRETLSGGMGFAEQDLVVAAE